MRPLKRFLARLLNSALQRRDDKRLQEEIEEHLALQTADNLRTGLTASEARRQALLKFGAVEAIQEEYWAEGGLAFLETLLQDYRFGWKARNAPDSIPFKLSWQDSAARALVPLTKRRRRMYDSRSSTDVGNHSHHRANHSVLRLFPADILDEQGRRVFGEIHAEA
jgi:hypothetical protein